MRHHWQCLAPAFLLCLAACAPAGQIEELTLDHGPYGSYVVTGYRTKEPAQSGASGAGSAGTGTSGPAGEVINLPVKPATACAQSGSVARCD